MELTFNAKQFIDLLMRKGVRAAQIDLLQPCFLR